MKLYALTAICLFSLAGCASQSAYTRAAASADQQEAMAQKGKCEMMASHAIKSDGIISIGASIDRANYIDSCMKAAGFVPSK